MRESMDNHGGSGVGKGGSLRRRSGTLIWFVQSLPHLHSAWHRGFGHRSRDLSYSVSSSHMHSQVRVTV